MWKLYFPGLTVWTMNSNTDAVSDFLFFFFWEPLESTV